MTTYRERYELVIERCREMSVREKVARLAQLIYANDRSQEKEDCVVQALEEYEAMTGRFFDPSRSEYEALIYSII